VHLITYLKVFNFVIAKRQSLVDSKNSSQSKDPLHGITLAMILRDVIDLYGYKELGSMTNIRAFEQKDKAIMKPILKFLRKTPWARKKIEDIYLRDLKKITSMKNKR
jgi:uncharacterized protein (DUF2132 family)